MEQKCDVHALKLEVFQKDIDRNEARIADLEKKCDKENKHILDLIEELRCEQTSMKLMFVEIRQDIKKIDNLDATLKLFIEEQREISKKIMEIEILKKVETKEKVKADSKEKAEIKEKSMLINLTKFIFSGSNKTFIFIIALLVAVIMILIGVRPEDALGIIPK